MHPCIRAHGMGNSFCESIASLILNICFFLYVKLVKHASILMIYISQNSCEKTMLLHHSRKQDTGTGKKISVFLNQREKENKTYIAAIPRSYLALQNALIQQYCPIQFGMGSIYRSAVCWHMDHDKLDGFFVKCLNCSVQDLYRPVCAVQACVIQGL